MIRADARVHGRPGAVVRAHQRVDHGQAPLPCPPALNARAKGSYDDVPRHVCNPPWSPATPLGALLATNSFPQRPRNTRPKVIFSYLVNTLRSLDRQNNTPASGGSSRGVITAAGRTAPGCAAQAARFS